MANVDLMGGDAQRIRGQYKTSLQRDASDDEVGGWLSGSYGGGGVDQWADQIAQSDEAKRLKPPSDNQPPPPVIGQTGQNNTGRPQSNAVTVPGGNDDTRKQIIDWYGQYLGRAPGQADFAAHAGNPYGQMGVQWAIQNSPEAKAYATRPTPTGGTTTNTGTGTGTGWDVDPKGNFQNWFLQNTGGMAPSPKALQALAPQLAKFGIKIGPNNARGWADTVQLPDGSYWDVIQSATGEGGASWQWIPAGGHSAAGPPGGPGMGTNAGVGGGSLPGNQYSDPYTQMLEGLIKSRIGTLQNPYDSFYRQQYEQGLQTRANNLGQANTQVTQLMDYLQTRFKDLQTPGYTGAENEVIRTGALDPIETDRAAARQRVMERLSARGLTPDSGIAQQALLEVDKQFDAMRGVTQNTLTTNDLARREDRQQRAQTIGGQLVDIPEARSREQLDVFQALEMLSQVARDEDASRSREAIGYAGGLNDLSAQRLQLAMQAAGMGGNPASLLSGLTGIAGLNNQTAALNRANSGSKWSGLGSLMAILAGSR